MKNANESNKTNVSDVNETHSKDIVDDIFSRVMQVGTKEKIKLFEPQYMFGRTFGNLEEHIWEILWLNE